MRQRIISTAVAIPLAIVVIFFYKTVFFNIAMAGVTLLAVYEIFVATKYLSNIVLVIICFVFAAVIPFFDFTKFYLFGEAFCYLFVISLFVFLLFNHKTMRLEQIGTIFLLTIMISFSFSCLVFIRDLHSVDKIANNLGLFYIVLVFLGAWITDAGAYFVGVFFGKHKLAPSISPKKTIEGAVGGVVSTMIVFLAAALIYGAYNDSLGISISVNYPMLIVAALLSSVAAILGDLAASLIKRECNIKDFGNILPGHGGILDRFDSIMFVAPLLYIFQQLLPIIGK